MKSVVSICLVLAAASAINLTAHSTDQTVEFRGLINNSCSIVVLNDGLLGVASDQTILSSKEAGGLQGTVNVLTNGIGATVEVVAPTGFSVAPPSGTVNTLFETSYSLSGVTVLADLVGSSVTPLGLGLTRLDLDASATKTSGTFESGAYELTTVVRCVTP